MIVIYFVIFTKPLNYFLKCRHFMAKKKICEQLTSHPYVLAEHLTCFYSSGKTFHKMLEHGCRDLLPFRHEHQWGQILMLGWWGLAHNQIYPKRIQLWTLCEFFHTRLSKCFAAPSCWNRKGLHSTEKEIPWLHTWFYAPVNNMCSWNI